MILETSGWRHLKNTLLFKIAANQKQKKIISPLRFKKSNYIIRLFSNYELNLSCLQNGCKFCFQIWCMSHLKHFYSLVFLFSLIQKLLFDAKWYPTTVEISNFTLIRLGCFQFGCACITELSFYVTNHFATLRNLLKIRMKKIVIIWFRSAIQL